MAIWLVLVVMTLVEATPRISSRTDALCTPMAARPSIEAATTGVVDPSKRLPAAKAAVKPIHSSVSSASAAASASACPAMAANVAATPPAKKTGTASTTIAPGHPARGGRRQAHNFRSPARQKTEQPEECRSVHKAGYGGEHNWNRARRLGRDRE